MFYLCNKASTFLFILYSSSMYITYCVLGNKHNFGNFCFLKFSLQNKHLFCSGKITSQLGSLPEQSFSQIDNWCPSINLSISVTEEEDPSSDERNESENKFNFESGGLLWWIVIAAAAGLIVISVLIIVCACCIRRKRYKKEKAKYKQQQQLPTAEPVV